ncbi:MAG: YybS family protein [candidate division Zixibacteria bacterium]|nr:YybS family protein [candidate division Zixibacteria bacterium]
MKLVGMLLALTFGLTVLATGGWLPAGAVFALNLALSVSLIFLFGRLPLGASLGWTFILTAASGWMGKSWMAAVVYLALTLLPAAAVGLAVAKKISYGRTLLVLAASALAPTALFVGFAYSSVQLQLLAFGETMKQTLAGLGAGLGSSARGEQFQKAVQSYLEFIVGVIPALYFISSFFFLALSHLLAVWALGRLGIFSPGPKKFITWQAPFFLVFLLGAGLASHLFLEAGWVAAADNLLVVVIFIYAVGGASNVEYFLKKLRAHWAVKGLFYVWMVLFGLASFFILSAVGFLDSRFDFRGLKKVALTKESEE